MASLTSVIDRIDDPASANAALYRRRLILIDGVDELSLIVESSRTDSKTTNGAGIGLGLAEVTDLRDALTDWLTTQTGPSL